MASRREKNAVDMCGLVDSGHVRTG